MVIHEGKDRGKPALYFYGPKGAVRVALLPDGLFFYDAEGNEMPGTVLRETVNSAVYEQCFLIHLFPLRGTFRSIGRTVID